MLKVLVKQNIWHPTNIVNGFIRLTNFSLRVIFLFDFVHKASEVGDFSMSIRSKILITALKQLGSAENVTSQRIYNLLSQIKVSPRRVIKPSGNFICIKIIFIA